MKKTLIISVTAIAIVLSAGMSMAGPLRDHDQRGHAQDVRTMVSQAFNPSDGMGNTLDVITPISQTHLQGTMPTAGSSGKSSIVYKECSDLWVGGHKGTECDITVDVHFLDVPEFSFDRTDLKNVLDIDAGTVVKLMRH